MRTPRLTIASPNPSVRLALTYSLVLSLCVPSAPRLDAAAVPAGRNIVTGVRQGAAGARYRDGELLVRFREGVEDRERSLVAAARGARRAGALRGESRVERLQLRAGERAELLAAELRQHPAVELAEPNYLVVRDDLTPNDPRFPEQWALRSTGAPGGQPGPDIGAAAAWEETTGAASTVVAVVDSGIDFAHPDLRGNRWTNAAESADGRDDDRNGFADDLHGWDWIAGGGAIRDGQGHGTAVAGLVAAAGNNRVGTSGVMWRASLMSLRVLDAAGTGSVADAVEAIDYAAANGAHVINCSWGTAGESAVLREAIERAGRRGAVVVASAGNGGANIDSARYYPASYELPNLIAVASTDSSDQLAAWSNWGARGVAVAAPGVGLLTTSAGGGYAEVSGTSASAPLVSGVAGLLKTWRPWASAAGVKSALLDGARAVPGLLGKVSSGGVLHAPGAIRALDAQPAPPGWAVGHGRGQGGLPPAYRPAAPGYGSGGTGPGGSFDVPARGRGRVSAPGLSLPDLDEARRGGGSRTSAPAPIQSNLCPTFDPDCSGGGTSEPPGGDPDFSTERVRPRNATGRATGNTSNNGQGVNPGSRNFNWALPLVGLRGRARLHLDLTLYYNSLVWTKQGTSIRFNTDRGWPGPGFRLGFPALQRQFTSQTTGGASYLLVDESGGRTELRRTGSFNTYEAADSSNVQLVEYYRVVARHSGKCLTVAGAGTGNGHNVEQQPCADAAQQQWQIVPTDGGYYRILARSGAKVLEVASGSAGDGANVQQWEYVGGQHQQWQITPVGGGYHRITARHSGKALDVAGASTADGANVNQWPYLGGFNQHWQLAPVAGQKVVRTPDGTQYTFAASAGGDFKCTEIKDRNGNFISVGYHASGALAGQIDKITDTLGRVVNFAYYADGNLEKITQARAGGAVYQWAKFYYGSVPFAPNFPGLTVYRPSGASITALTRVDLPDGSFCTFEYGSPSWGVVKRINRHRSDGQIATYVSYNLPPTSAGQSDSPRFTERREWARYWNGDLEGTPAAAEEAITTYAVAENAAWTMPTDGTQHTGTLTQVTTPDGTVHKQYAKSTGWQTGLPMLEETWAAGSTAPDKQNATSWTQDDTAVSFPLNPRVAEVNVYDATGNRRRTGFEYGAYGLLAAVFEYGAGGSSLVRQTNFDYDFHPGYTDRRIIGLQTVREVYEVSGTTYTIVARTTNTYDSTAPQSPGAIARHDAANYGAAFTHGRGNLTAKRRFDAADPYNMASAVAETVAYDTAGSVVSAADAVGHRTDFSYADSFSDGVGRSTYAYPTAVADPDQAGRPTPKRTAARYDFDTGEITRAEDTKGAIRVFVYEAAGRVERVKTQKVDGVDYSYARFVYGPDYVQEFATVQEGAGEAYSITVFDGAGRFRANGVENPGSAGGYSGRIVEYDAMGRARQTSNPTEMTAGWAAAGDDAAAGWLWTTQTYDWQGRPRLTTYPLVEGQAAHNTSELTYAGCGCAGGEVVTARDERGRRRKLYDDVFGRLRKVEELNWDQTVYSTTTYEYNARDQIESINQQGQTRAFEYDGHGRLWQRTTPEQGRTQYAYNPDDTVASVTDARGVVASYGYNGRHLTTSVGYTVPAGSGVAPTANVGYAYDEAGNRTSMTDGLGSVAYDYDALSRLSREERTFAGVGTFRLSYDYNLAGQLARLVNPWGTHVAYEYDRQGRLAAVKGTDAAGTPTFAGVATYAQGIQYRASGAPKAVTYGNGQTLTLAYDRRLRLTEWKLPGVMWWQYDYSKFGENTGRVTYAKNVLDPTLDRSYDYDHAGRLWEAHSGNEARAHAGLEPWPTAPDGPYSHSYRYDEHGNMIHRVGWGGWFGSYVNQYQTFAGNRQQTNPANNQPMRYDASGHLAHDGRQSFQYDATGQQTSASATNLQQGYDGDGLRARRVEAGETTHYLRSSALGGQAVVELRQSPGSPLIWDRGYVFAGLQTLAIQHAGAVRWVHSDPVTKSQRVKAGAATNVIDLDPWGGETARSSGASSQPRRFTTYTRDENSGDEAMFRRYEGRWQRFAQPDPYAGSSDPADPQTLNRYSYVVNDPVNLIDPTGLAEEPWDPGDIYIVNTWAWPWIPGGNTWSGRYQPLSDSGEQRGGGLPGLPPPQGGYTCNAPAIKAELNRLHQDALRAANAAEREAAAKFKSAFSPGMATVEGVGTTVLWAAIKQAPLTLAEIGGSAGIGLAVHGAVTLARDSHNWETEKAQVRGKAYDKVKRAGVGRIQQKYSVLLPYALHYPYMSPC